jgi:Concanavalin A-like lectin/glucanases superfamily/Immunoglobulin I-set domain
MGAHDATAGPVIHGVAGALRNDNDTGFGFDGATSFVEVPYSADLNTSNFTLEFWAKANDTRARQVVKSTSMTGEWITGGYFLDACWGTEIWGLRTTGTRWNVYSRRLVPNQWTHLVASFDGSNEYLYVNGVLSSSLVCTNYAPNASNPTRYGGESGAAFWGALDEIAMYDHALPEDRVTLHYGLAKYGTNIAPIILSPPLPRSVIVGRPAVLVANVYGDPAPGFQWSKDGSLIPGATRSSFTLSSACYSDTGFYSVAIENSLGSTNTEPVKLSVMPPPRFCQLTNGLVLHLKFDGDCLDSSGRTNHGTPVGAPQFVSGRIGSGALHYKTDTESGVYDYVTLGRPNDLQFSSNVNFTVSYWARFTGTPGDLPFLCNSRNSLTTPGFAFAPSYKEGSWAWTLCATYSSSSTSGSIECLGFGEPGSINDGEWHHLLHSFDRENDGVTYVDGVRVHSISVVVRADATINQPGAVNIGQDATGRYAESGEVDIDDLGVWRRALSPSEAECVYLAAKNYGLSFDSYGPVTILIDHSAADLGVIWQAGLLEAADDVSGPWEPVPGATAPYYRMPVNGTQKFYRARL